MAFSVPRTLLVLAAVVALTACVESPKGWCSSDSDCPSGTRCTQNLCLTSEAGATDGGSLADGGHLNDGGSPTDGGLSIDGGHPTDGGQPQCAGAQACSQPSDCPSMICHAGCCANTCESSADCPSGTTCQSGMCQSPGCSSSADCSGTPALPVCDPSTRTCVACLSNSDCGDPNKLCTTHNQCVWGPGKCGADSDCSNPAASFCDTATESCVQCLSNTQCPTGEQCQNNACVPIAGSCHNDHQCSGNTPHCDQQRSVCVQCTTSSQCRSGEQCTNDVCTLPPGACRTDADCTDPSARFCLTSASRCVACLQTEQCGAGQTCQNNACTGSVGACAHDEDCNGLVCVPQPNRSDTAWVNQCQIGTFFGGNRGGDVCKTGTDCASGVCHLPNSSGSDGICIDACTPSTASADCASDAQCPVNGVSIYLPASTSGGTQNRATAAICWPRSCVSDSDCQGLGTNGSDWTCDLQPDPLRPTTDLVQACYPTLGTGRGGQACRSSSDCASGWCQTWQDPQTGTQRQECFEACQQDSDCPTGVRCYTGIQLIANEVGRVNACAAF